MRKITLPSRVWHGLLLECCKMLKISSSVSGTYIPLVKGGVEAPHRSPSLYVQCLYSDFSVLS